METSRKSGGERFSKGSKPMDYDLLSFWQWAYSNLIGNTARGAVAEYLVGRALGLAKTGIRNDWAPYDLTTGSGLKIEVKSAAYVQTWFQKDYSKISFGVAPRRAWDPSINDLSEEAKRHSDVYVFALLKHRQKKTVNPMDVDQWEFYVLPTSALNGPKDDQQSITLKTLQGLCKAVGYDALGQEVESVGGLKGDVEAGVGSDQERLKAE